MMGTSCRKLFQNRCKNGAIVVSTVTPVVIVWHEGKEFEEPMMTGH
jgi:hypothetical protein